MFFKIVGAVVVIVGGTWLSGVAFAAMVTPQDSMPQFLAYLPWTVCFALTVVLTAFVIRGVADA